MAKIRADLIGITIVRDQSGRDIILHPGDTIPKGVSVGAHLTGTDAPVEGTPKVPIPKKTGPGSSVDAWREYAATATKAAGLHIDIPEDATRADIIEALNASGIPTE